ncbi:MAG: hypothetical protein QM770_23050 [Tepidisphaeraceae bacterium]
MSRLGVKSAIRNPQSAIVLLALLLHAFYLSGYPLSGTEGHRALPGHTMVTTGNWLVPMLGGQPYLRKPPAMYWATGLSELAFGPHEWAWRIPSLIGAVGAAWAVAWFARRWFGNVAGWWAGLAQCALLALWNQSRLADIDSLNTFATTLAGLCVIDLAWMRVRRDEASPASGSSLRSDAGVIVGLLALSGTLAVMLKGPACLPVLIGAVVAAWKGLRQPVWLQIGVLVGAVACSMGVWGVLARHWLSMHGIAPDFSGAEEGAENIAGLFTDPKRLLSALLVPMLVVLYAMPASIGLLFVASKTVRPALEPNVRRLLWTITLAFLVGLATCLLSGMTNPRYAYVLMPWLAVLAGGVASSYGKLTPVDQWWVRTWLVVTSLALAGAMVGLGVASSRVRYDWTLVVASIAGAALLCPLAIAWVHDLQFKRVWLTLAGMLVCLAIVFTPQFNAANWRQSSIAEAGKLRELIKPADSIAAGRYVLSKPEIFWYARLRVVSPGQRVMRPDEVQPGQFVLLFSNPNKPDDEWSLWNTLAKDRLRPVGTIRNDDKRVGYIVWYE